MSAEAESGLFARMKNIDLTLGGSTIIDHISLDVRRGEVLAVVGANGAGKSSLLKCLSGMWMPSLGEITIDDHDRIRDDLAIRRFTAFLPADPEPVGGSIRNSLKVIAEAYGVEEERYRNRQDALLRLFDLKEIQDRPVLSLSKGQKKKACVAGALVSGCRFLILDEPFTGGIDPKGFDALRQVLVSLRDNRQITVVFSTQILDVAVAVADRIAVIDKGRLATVGTIDELREESGVGEEAGLNEVFARLASEDPGKSIEALMAEMAGEE